MLQQRSVWYWKLLQIPKMQTCDSSAQNQKQLKQFSAKMLKKENQQQLPYLHFRSQENTSGSHEHWIYTFQRIPAKQQTAHDVQASHGSKQQQVMMMTVSV